MLNATLVARVAAGMKRDSFNEPLGRPSQELLANLPRLDCTLQFLLQSFGGRHQEKMRRELAIGGTHRRTSLIRPKKQPHPLAHRHGLSASRQPNRRPSARNDLQYSICVYATVCPQKLTAENIIPNFRGIEINRRLLMQYYDTAKSRPSGENGESIALRFLEDNAERLRRMRAESWTQFWTQTHGNRTSHVDTEGCLLMSAFGVKRTSPIALPMSALDPKLTLLSRAAALFVAT